MNSIEARISTGPAVADIFLDKKEELQKTISSLQKNKHLSVWSKESLPKEFNMFNETRTGDVIVTTSGMLEGGPAIWYLNRLRMDRRNSVFITGYQAEGTGGRMLLEKSRLPIYGNITQIDLETKSSAINLAKSSDFYKGSKKVKI